MADHKQSGSGRFDHWLHNLLNRTQDHYILAMMLGTRLFGSIGGLLVIYYVELALTLPSMIRIHFRAVSLVVVVVACSLTVLLALWETRTLRRVLRRMKRKEPTSPEEYTEAAHEATIFANRHHRHEAWLVPSSTLLPALIFLYLVDDASGDILLSITLTVFMGISMALMSTFFAVEKAMQPVIHRLLDAGAKPRYATLPQGRLYFRFGLCSTLIIITTALMISLLARQRAVEIISIAAEHRERAVSTLVAHSVYITLAAVITGVTYSHVLTHSVSHRVESLVDAMDRVAAGKLSVRIQPTGTDEIDRLARRFNTMVATLHDNHRTILDLNTNLEDKVRQRTTELEEALRRLRDTQSQVTDLARRAGMAEVATGVLHNVGNVLNSVNVSATCIGDRVRNARTQDLQRLIENLEAQDDVSQFLSDPARAQKTLQYLVRLMELLDSDKQDVLKEITCLTENIGHVKGIINTQQRYAKRVSFRSQVDIAQLLREVLGMYQPRLEEHAVQVSTDLPDGVVTVIEKPYLLQVFDNLIHNAIDAMVDVTDSARILSVTLHGAQNNRVVVEVTDTGCGISEVDLKKIFTFGFTTKNSGNGFGLHSTALAIANFGGKIRADSPGEGQGTTFRVDFPLVPEEAEHDRFQGDVETGKFPAHESPAGRTLV